jgi:hypothetical protein
MWYTKQCDKYFIMNFIYIVAYLPEERTLTDFLPFVFWFVIYY